MPKKTVSLMLSVILIFLSFTACSKHSGSGMDLIFPITAEPASLDPQIAENIPEKTVVANCLEGLVRLGENGQILPGTALNWEQSSDGKVYTFHLRNNAKWHLIDGHESILGEDCAKTFDTAVTANDFVFAFRRAVSPSTGSPDADSLFVIKNAIRIFSGSLPSKALGVEAVDRFTLKITLVKSSPDFINLLASPICMPCNENFFTAAKGKYGLEDDYLLCNGPFYLSVWTHDSSLTLRRNKDYTGDSEVAPNSVVLSISPKTDKYLQKLSVGNYTAAPLNASAAQTAEKDSEITLTEYKNITWSLCFNCRDDVLKNTSLRVALCKAVDSTSFKRQISENNTSADYFVPSCCEIGQTPFRELAEGGYAVKLDNTGAKASWDKGLEETECSSVSIALLCPAEYEQAMRQMFQHWQKTLGISLEVTVEVLETEDITARVKSGNYQIALAPVKSETGSAVGFLQNFTAGSDDNIFHYSSKTYYNILRQLKMGGGIAETVQGCRKAEANLMRNGVVYPLFSESSYLALGSGTYGIYASPAGETVYFINGKKTG